jgi:predicted  nucleic acid-binding Zn-ribbon protein
MNDDQAQIAELKAKIQRCERARSMEQSALYRCEQDLRDARRNYANAMMRIRELEAQLNLPKKGR